MYSYLDLFPEIKMISGNLGKWSPVSLIYVLSV